MNKENQLISRFSNETAPSTLSGNQQGVRCEFLFNRPELDILNGVPPGEMTLVVRVRQRTRRIELWSSIAVLVVVVLLTFGVFTPRFGVYHDETVSFYISEPTGLSLVARTRLGAGASRICRPDVGYTRKRHRGSPADAALSCRQRHSAPAHLAPRAGRSTASRPYGVHIVLRLSALLVLGPAIVNLAIDGSLFFCLLSFALCALAIEVSGWKRWCAVFASIACVPIYFFLYELPFPLEALRPLLLWRTLHDGVAEAGRPRWLRTLMWSLPWLVLAGGLGCYRLFVFKSSGFYQSINYNTPSLPPTLGGEIGTRLTVLWDQLIGTWLYHIAQLPRALTSLDLAVAAATILAIILYAFVNYRIIRSDLGQHRPRGIFAVGLIGLFILVIGNFRWSPSDKRQRSMAWRVDGISFRRSVRAF